MIVIVGLGNPEDKYGKTRHNAGFLLIDRLIERAGLTPKWQQKGNYKLAKAKISDQEVALVKPNTFMNASGLAVAEVLNWLDNPPLSNLWLVYDDVTVSLGSFRVRDLGGSSGGHNGVESVIEHVGTGEFGRIRVGIGPAPEMADLAKYVLRPFSRGERASLNTVLDAVSDYVVASIRLGKLEKETIHV